MTEQPVETEQQFLGNAIRGNADVGSVELVPLPEIPLQHYVPGAHLRRLPLWSPGDDAEAAALIRTSINANKLLAIAKAQSTKAEDALQLVLDVEEEAALKAREAQGALTAFTRKDTGL